jgi:hypothetical protein
MLEAGTRPITPSKLVASDSDMRQFRAHMGQVRRAARGLPVEALAQLLALPLAVRHALSGVAHYGRAVRERDGVSLARQFAYLAYDYFTRARPDDFYMYQLYLPTHRRMRSRHFSFTEIVVMQQYLTDLAGSSDYPLLRSKSKFAAKCTEHGLPTVPLLAEFVGGHAKPTLPVLPKGDLFSKPSDLMLGLGTALWRWNTSGNYVHATSGESLSGPDLCKRLSAESRTAPTFGGSGAIILQEKVSNHQSMLGALTTSGLATVRVVTCRTPHGSVDMLPTVIRMPVGDAIADNIAQGGLAAPIDSESGQICGPAICKDKRLGISTCTHHPTTAVALAGFPIPFWPEILDLARQAHEVFPTMHFIGWDIAVLDRGPVLLEGDALWDSDLTVLPHRIGISDTQFIPYYNHHVNDLREKDSKSRRNQERHYQ